MRYGDHETRTLKSRRREGFRPRAERLEPRELMAIDLANIAGGASTTAPGPYGVLESGLTTSGGAGFSVAAVGDVNGDGYDDFVIGAPSITRNGTGPAIGGGAGAQAFLIFGSRDSRSQIQDFLALTPQQRIGDLAQIGSIIQTNPVNGLPGFTFNGLAFSASQNASSALGASVAAVGDVNGDGFPDFMIGAPNANDATGNFNAAGRAYLIYGGTNLDRVIKTVDLDNPTANSDLNILTFVNNQANASTGRSVGFAGDIFLDGLPDIAIGAPNAAINGLSNSGAVYAISGAALRPARTQTITLQSVGQGGPTNVSGAIFTGASAGDRAGFSVAAGGNFAGQTVNTLNQNTLLIGSPQISTGPGQVAVIYATPGLINSGLTVNGLSLINLNRVGATVNGVNGAIFTGSSTGEETGFSVASAGDFNNDGVGDILIGSPGFNGNSGRANMIFGRRVTATVPAITGTFNLDTLPATVPQVEFTGVSAGALAGFSLSSVGSLNNDRINEILIGSPGVNNGQGQVYLIPGNPDLAGTFSLTDTENQPVQGLIITSTQPTGNPNYLGSSVSGRIGTNAAGHTSDSDTLNDFVIGSAGLNLTGSRVAAGGGYLLEGAFIPLQNVVSTAITSPIGVGKVSAPFAINATAPADLQIYILSAGSNTPGFQPFRDIDPTTLTVNGVAVPDPTTFKQEADLDGDGVPDASFIFSPRSLLNLPNGTVTFIVAARTLPTSPFPSRRYTGTAPVTVNGGGSDGGNSGGLPSSRVNAFGNLGANNAPNLPYGERLVPTNAILRRLKYKPIPIEVAHKQFLPTNGFSYRNYLFYHPSQKSKNALGSNAVAPQRQDHGHGVFTIGHRVFNRSRFPSSGTFRGRIANKGHNIP